MNCGQSGFNYEFDVHRFGTINLQIQAFTKLVYFSIDFKLSSITHGLNNIVFNLQSQVGLLQEFNVNSTTSPTFPNAITFLECGSLTFNGFDYEGITYNVRHQDVHTLTDTDEYTEGEFQIPNGK